MKTTLPIFEFVIDDTEETGVKAVSIVSNPAFGSSLIAFNKEDKPKFVQIKLGNYKQIVAGLSLIPNVPVYREDAEVGSYLGYFTPETIEKIVEKYHQEMLSNQVNIEHNDKQYIDAFMVEDYIVNSQARIDDLKARGIEHPNIMGAWYTAFKIKDPEVFQAILQSGDATGFSVEAYLERFMKEFSAEVKNKIISTKVKSEMTKNNKTLKEKILQIFTEVENFKRALVPELAFDIEWAGKGEPVNKVIVDQNGNETLQPIGQGEFATDQGIVVVDEQSNLVEIRDLPKQPAPEVPATSGQTSGTTGQTTTVSGATAIVGDQSARKIQVPEVSGTTSGDTKVSGSTELPLASGSTSTTSTTGGTKKTSSGSTNPSGSTSGNTSTGTTKPSATTDGLNKSIKDLCPVAGDYIIQVSVDDTGTITEATVTSQKDLLPQTPGQSGMTGGFSARVKKAFERIQELEAKMKEPISDPILAPEKKVLTQDEFKKLTPFEKIKYNRGW